MNRISLFFFAALTALAAVWSIAASSTAAQSAAASAENSAASTDETAEPPAPLIGPPAPAGLTAEQAAVRAADTSHEVRAKEEERNGAGYAVDQARAAFIPRLTSGARYTRLSRIDQASLGNLVAAPGASAGPLQPGAQLAAAPLKLAVLLSQYALEASLEVPVSDYALRQSYRVRRVLFQNGRATSVELTDAETKWSRAQLDVIGARIDRRIAEARLVHALGADVKEEDGHREIATRGRR